MDYKDYKYNLVREKNLLEFINSNEKPLRRRDIKQYAVKLDILDRTLSDILKRNVKDGLIQRLSHGLYIGKLHITELCMNKLQIKLERLKLMLVEDGYNDSSIVCQTLIDAQKEAINYTPYSVN